MLGPRGRRWALFGLLALALLLRLVGIDWGLRHLPVQYERVFVQSVWDMVAAGDLDQRSYLYPGLIFYLLAIPVWVVEHLHLGIGNAYLVCRATVASFGVLSVFLAYLVGSEMAGEAAGLGAAALLAVSPLEVETAHAVRPDVVLESFVLLGILAFRRLEEGWKAELRAGVAIGAATAVKFTGALLVPVYLGFRLLGSRRALGRVIAVGAVSVAVFFVLTPYALIAPGRFGGGVHEQWSFHYAARSDGQGHLDLVLYYLGAVVSLVGPLGACLLLAGFFLLGREWRVYAPPLILPVLSILVFSTAKVGGARFLVPSGGILCAVAAAAAARIEPRLLRTAAVPLAFASSLVLSVAHDRHFLQPVSWDVALDWLEGNAPPQARILTTEKHLGLSRNRYRVVWPETNYWQGDPPEARDRLVAGGMDLVVAAAGDPTVSGFRPLFVASGDPYFAWAPPLTIFAPPQRRALDLHAARLTASENEPLLPNLLGGDHTHFWQTAGLQSPDSFLRVEFPSPVRLVLVELTLRNHVGSRLRIRTDRPGEGESEPAFAEVDETATAPPRQVLFLDGTPVTAFRVVPEAAAGRATRWSVTSLRAEELSSSP